MNILFPILEGKKELMVPGQGVVYAAPGFQFFATQNDASYANRHKLPLALRNRFLEVQVEDFPRAELATILHQRREIGSNSSSLELANCEQLAQMYIELSQNADDRITLRELIKWIRRKLLFEPTCSWAFAGFTFLSSRRLRVGVSDKLDELENKFIRIFGGRESKLQGSEITIEYHELQGSSGQGSVVFSERLEQSRGIEIRETSSLSFSPLFEKGRKPPMRFQHALVRLMQAYKAGEPVLLIGPTSFKSLLVQTWAKLCQKETDMITAYLTPDTETPELIGQMHPFTVVGALREMLTTGNSFLLRFAAVKTTLNGEARVQLDQNKPMIAQIRKELERALEQLNESVEKFATANANLGGTEAEDNTEPHYFNDEYDEDELVVLSPSDADTTQPIFEEDDFDYQDLLERGKQQEAEYRYDDYKFEAFDEVRYIYLCFASFLTRFTSCSPTMKKLHGKLL
jgi:hypothetical protein